MQHDNTIILSFKAAPLLARLLLAASAGDEELASRTARELQETDPPAATLAPIILAPYAARIEITVPWLEDIRIYSPLATTPEPTTLTQLLNEACQNGAKITLTTRSGTRDREALGRLRVITALPRRCLELHIAEKIHTKLYRAELGKLAIEALTTANLTASEIWKTRIGQNKTVLQAVKL